MRKSTSTPKGLDCTVKNLGYVVLSFAAVNTCEVCKNYNDEGLGFFFELPDDWSFAPEVYNPSFPSARHFTSDRGMITVMTGEVEDSMICAASRENLFKQYLGSMGFTNVELNRDGNKLGTESNVIFAYYHQGQRKECMISAGYMGRHFLIRYEGNLTERVNNV